MAAIDIPMIAPSVSPVVDSATLRHDLDAIEGSKPTPWWHVRPILLILLIGTALRLTLLTQPAIWGDEAATYSRIAGSYRDLLDIIQENDAFVPLHYEMYWALSKVLQMSPVMMRLIPALSGILMVPAMYFLARQLVSRWAANLAALFTACSAYMLTYSRDAKMYPLHWLLCTLAIGCFLWWLNSGRRIAWLGWIASNLGALGTHMPGFLLLPLLPLIVLTCRRPSWKQGILTIVGLLVIAAGPVGYYAKFNTVARRSTDQNFNDASGTSWVEDYNSGRSGPDHVIFTATAFLFSWEWPRAQDQTDLDQQRLWWLEEASEILFGAILLGILPWPRAWRATVVRDEPETPWRWWRSALWLSLWMAIPFYWFYTKSVTGYVSPLTWIDPINDAIKNQWLALGIGTAAAAIVLAILLHRGQRAIALGILTAVLLITNVFLLPRGFPEVSRAWVNGILIVVAVIFYSAGNTLSERALNTVLLATVAAAVIGVCQLMYLSIKPSSGSLWMPRYLGVTWPAFAIIVAVLISRLPTRAVRWAVIAALLIVNFKQFGDRIAWNVHYREDGGWLITGVEPPVDQMAYDVIDSDSPRRMTFENRRQTWSPRSNTRVYATTVNWNYSPGTANLITFPGRYYLTVMGEIPESTMEFRGGSSGQSDYIFGFDQQTDDSHVAQDASQHPQLDRIIVWDRVPDQAKGLSQPDTLIRQLGPKWDLITSEQYRVAVHWMWTPIDGFRRREYRKRAVVAAIHGVKHA